ncbi:ArsA-related P-loop ATPase [Streptomyces sp. NPDC127098]|uniref:ArsA family ATPase n=1 Tax=Streptomyces sp. NPDC127098 TaxID=3347137 RepID=UPI003648BE04
MTGEAAGARTLLVTGPGGDGTSTVAAATAVAAARAGRSTLLLSQEPADRLAALLGTAPPAWPEEPVEFADGPAVARIDAAGRFRAGALAAQRHVRPALDALGAGVLDDDELTELPGAAPLALLHALRTAHAAARWSLVVVDLPPVTEAIRALALPGQLRRYLRRLLPPERQTARALRPLVAQLLGVPLPAQSLYETADRWDGELAALQRLVEGPGTAVRLVLDPTERSAAQARAARAGLALHGVGVEALIANRLLPAGSGDPLLAGLAAGQRAVLDEFTRATRLAAPHPVPHLGRPVRPADLAELPLPPLGEPGDAGAAEPTVEDRLATDGLLVWHLPLPGATRDDLGLVRRGDELLVTTGPFRRALPLPAALRRCTVAGAAFTDAAELAVRFAPDPDRWPDRALAGVPRAG